MSRLTQQRTRINSNSQDRVIAQDTRYTYNVKLEELNFEEND